MKFIVKMIKNLISLFVILFCLIDVFFKTNLFYSRYLLILYSILDSFYSKTEIVIHHILVILITTFSLMYSSESSMNMIRIILTTEFSTIFLLVNNIIIDSKSKNKYLLLFKNLNYLPFVISFFVHRIYGYYNMISNLENYHYLNELTQDFTIKKIHLYSGFYGLYLMNIYWFAIICKKLYKMCLHELVLKNDINQEYILKYSIFFHIIFQCYVTENPVPADILKLLS